MLHHFKNKNRRANHTDLFFFVSQFKDSTNDLCRALFCAPVDKQNLVREKVLNEASDKRMFHSRVAFVRRSHAVGLIRYLFWVFRNGDDLIATACLKLQTHSKKFSDRKDVS